MRKMSFVLNGDWCFCFCFLFSLQSWNRNETLFFFFRLFIHAPTLLLWFCLLSLFSNRAMQRVNFSTYIHINIYTRQVAGYCAISIHITPLALMKQFCVLIPCDSECMTCSIWWKAQAKFNLQQSVMEICKMARFSVNERTIDNAIQLAAKAAIWIAVKRVIARVALRQLPFTKGPWQHKKSSRTTRKA